MTTPLHELSPEELLLEFSNLIEKDGKLNHDQLPGFSKLLRDEYDPDIEVTPEDFARRTLKALRDTGDETDGEDYDYLQGMLADYTSNQQSSLNKFIDGTPIGEVAAGLEVGPTQGTRLALEEMHHAPSVPLSSLIASEAPAEANGTRHLMVWSHDKAEFDLFEDDEKKSPITVSAAKSVWISLNRHRCLSMLFSRTGVEPLRTSRSILTFPEPLMACNRLSSLPPQKACQSVLLGTVSNIS